MPAGKPLTEEAVRHQLSLMTSTMDFIPDLIFYKDLEGVYLGCNRALCELIGRPVDELVVKTDFDLFPENLAKSFRGKDQEMLDSGQTKRNDEWVDYPDGRRVLLDTLKTSLIDGRGRQREIHRKDRTPVWIAAASGRHSCRTGVD